MSCDEWTLLLGIRFLKKVTLYQNLHWSCGALLDLACMGIIRLIFYGFVPIEFHFEILLHLNSRVKAVIQNKASTDYEFTRCCEFGDPEG